MVQPLWRGAGVIPHRADYIPGQRVLVEGTVVDWEYGRPFGAVTVRFEAATDPAHRLDGVTIVVPQILCSDPGVDVPNYEGVESD